MSTAPVMSMESRTDTLDQLGINTLRFLVVDAVQAASGSEVALALAAAQLLAEQGIAAMVLSVMWREQLDRAMAQHGSVLPDVPAVWIEAGAPTGWRAVARKGDSVIGLQRFGDGGRGQAVAEHLGLSASSVAETALRTLGLSATADETAIGA